MAAWSLRLAAAAAVLLGAAGCDTRDMPSSIEPGPAVVVTVLPGSDACLLDGRPMGEPQVRSELVRLIESDRQASRLANPRLRLRLVLAQGADWSRQEALVQYCQSLGINRIELPSGR